MPDFVNAGEFPDRELGDAFRYPKADETPLVPEEQADAHFVKTRIVVSPTSDTQRWRVPGTDNYLSAEKARDISLDVRQRLGRSAL